MLLNNFRYFVVNTLKGSWGFGENTTATRRIKFTDGSLFSYSPSQPRGISPTTIALLPSKFYNTADNTSAWVTSYSYMVLGTGDTPPTVEDYKLSGELITSLTYQGQPTLNDNNSLTYSILVTNNTKQPVTIKEVCLAIGTGTISSKSGAAVLLTRDVLPNPVTLNVGDSKTFSITIDFRSLTDTTVNE
jgi:hypothetical protein